MTEADIENILQRAMELYPEARPRIISDNGPQFIARDFKEFIRISGMTHARTSPSCPQSNGKIERWHKSLTLEQRHRLHHAERHADRASARDPGRTGSKAGSGPGARPDSSSAGGLTVATPWLSDALQHQFIQDSSVMRLNVEWMRLGAIALRVEGKIEIRCRQDEDHQQRRSQQVSQARVPQGLAVRLTASPGGCLLLEMPFMRCAVR
jgi:hypothetical protein